MSTVYENISYTDSTSAFSLAMLIVAVVFVFLRLLCPLLLPQLLMWRLHKRAFFPDISLRRVLSTTALLQIFFIVVLYFPGLTSGYTELFVSLYLLVAAISTLVAKSVFHLSYRKSILLTFGMSLAIIAFSLVAGMIIAYGRSLNQHPF